MLQPEVDGVYIRGQSLPCGESIPGPFLEWAPELIPGMQLIPRIAHTAIVPTSDTLQNRDPHYNLVGRKYSHEY
jgi:hypothetical protein